MKYLVASDIHGSAAAAKQIIYAFEQHKCDKLLLLGDFLYHGPKNKFPDEYNPQQVAETLNSVAKNIIAIKGNCDAEVDQMLLHFPLNDSAIIELGKKTIFCTHGQHVNPDKPLENLADGTVVLYGHFHNIKQTMVGAVNYINIGSCALPKHDTVKCYAVLDENKIEIYDFNDNLVNTFLL